MKVNTTTEFKQVEMICIGRNKMKMLSIGKKEKSKI